MHSARSFTLLALSAATMLGPARSLAAWGTNTTTGNLPVSTAANEQYSSNAFPDGANGAIVVWYDLRTGVGDIYAQRVTANGTAVWTANGVGVCTAVNSQLTPRAIPDGSGGAYVVWSDWRAGSSPDIYAQRLDGNGNALWTPNGVAVCAATGSQSAPFVVRDAAGGAIVAWSDTRSGDGDVWAQRISPDGALLWTGNGVQLTGSSGTQTEVYGTANGVGGAVFAWTTQTMFGDPPTAFTVQSVDSSGLAQWGSNGIALGPAFTSVYDRDVCPGGTGGAIVGWRTGDGTVLAQRLDASGAPQWGSGGNPLAVYDGASGAAASMALVTDDAAGAFLSWTHGSPNAEDLRAQHVTSAGGAAWTANGVTVCNATGRQSHDAILSDGAGGAGIAWSDFRGGGGDIYTQKLGPTGTAQWTPNGVAICTATSSQYFSSLVPSTSAGWIVAWEDYRAGATRDLYAQFVDRFGYLGDASPVLSTVSDVPGDQGGVVSVSWASSYLDRSSNRVVVEYRVLRQSDTAPFSARRPHALGTSWELVATVTANSAATYSVQGPSDGDDVLGVHPVTTYRIEAHSSPAGTGPQWTSAAVGGWSVDNLAPPRPTSFIGSYSAGTTSMTWDASPALDFGTFRLHRSSDFDFTPGPGNQIAEITGTSHADPAGDAYYYRLVAVDVHENSSESAVIAPGPLDAGPGPAAVVSLGAPRPHPLRGQATIRFVLPRSGPASLALFDVAGRRAATLASGTLPAGVHEVSWNPERAEGGRLANGVYLLQLETVDRRIVRRVVLAR